MADQQIDLDLMTDEERKQLMLNIADMLQREENLTKLLHAILPHVTEGKRTLVYILDKFDRIGHLLQEPFMLTSMQGDQFDEFLLLTGPRAADGANPHVFKLYGPEIVPIVTDDPVLPIFGILDGGLQQLGPFHIWLISPDQIHRQFIHHRVAGGTLRPYTQPEELRQRGEALRASLGMQPEERFILMHVRDLNYLPGRRHHAHRCATVENFRLAIEALIDRGYWVFRIGDPSSVPLEHKSGRMVHVPHIANYEGWMDLALAGSCHFGLLCESGPEAMVRLQGRPSLMVNIPPIQHLAHFEHDVFLFKPVFDLADGHRLTYREVLARGLVKKPEADAFTEAGVRVGENNPQELLAAVLEMDDRLAGQFDDDPAFEEGFRELSRQYEVDFQAACRANGEADDIYDYAHGWGRIAQAPYRFHPEFLT